MVSRYSILSSTGKVLKHIPTFLYQLLILLWKNALLFRSHYNITLLMIFSPVLICLYLNYQQALTNNYIHSKNLIDSPIVSVDRIPKCYGKDCITLAIGMTHGANAWTDHVIQYLEGNHDLKLGTDIQILSYSNQTLFLESIKKYSNHTQAGVLFCTEYIDLPKNDYTDRIPCKLGNNTDNSFVYSMMYNYTTTKLESFIDLTKNYPIDYSAVALKLAIDRATLEYLSLTQGIHAEINLNIQSYPIIESRYLSGFDVISEGGAMYFLLPSLIVMAVVCMEIVKEKENKLRMGLITLGTSHLAYWVSWILTANFLSVVSNSVLMCTGYYLEYDVFRRVPILVLIYTFYLSSFGLNMLGMVLSACISTTKSAYSALFAIILVSLVFQRIISYQICMEALYTVQGPSWISLICSVLELYPPFNFSKIYFDISMRASRRYSLALKRMTEAGRFKWKDFYTTAKGDIKGVGFIVPSTYNTCIVMIWDIVLYTLLLWYLDHIISSNRGRSL